MYTWCGLSANLGCTSETCSTRLAEYTGRQIANNSPSGHHLKICRAISSQLRHISTIGKTLLNSNISSTCPHNMVNFGPLAAEIGSLVWGTPSEFQQVSHLSSVTARHSSSGRQTNFAALSTGRHLHSVGRPSRCA